ncbi:hypothetical protein, partial [Microcoleus anatoxicus]|uniref:hypothetical protein n=1 Tax=Microcoleus anatoxicus TaxID=2705319 RepID=UPI0030C935E4
MHSRVSIAPILAIALCLVWNLVGKAENEKAGLMDASTARLGMNSLANRESRLKPTEIPLNSPLQRTS